MSLINRYLLVFWSRLMTSNVCHSWCEDGRHNYDHIHERVQYFFIFYFGLGAGECEKKKEENKMHVRRNLELQHIIIGPVGGCGIWVYVHQENFETYHRVLAKISLGETRRWSTFREHQGFVILETSTRGWWTIEILKGVGGDGCMRRAYWNCKEGMINW